jgi:hypothetical protein
MFAFHGGGGADAGRSLVLGVVPQFMPSQLKMARPQCTHKLLRLREVGEVEVVRCIPCPLKIVQMRPIHPLDALVAGAVEGSYSTDNVHFCGSQSIIY